MLIRLTCLILALYSISVTATEVDINWMADGRFGYEALLKAGAVDELCSPLKENQQVDWHFESDQPLDFNIHYHIGDEVQYPVKEAAVTELSDRFTAPVEQTYCWMLTNNQDGPAIITTDFQRDPN